MPGCAAYRWTGKDKFIYFVVMVPFLIGFLGSLVLLGRIAIILPIIVVILFFLIAVFQAGCCVGCPYRGTFCPAIFGIYPANIFSRWLYKNREFEQKFFNINASIAETLLGTIVVFTGYFLTTINWVYTVAYLLLAGLHFALFLVFICPKCSYNETCPGGVFSCRLMKRLRGGAG